MNGFSIIDYEVGPFDSVDAIEADLKRVKALPCSLERDMAIETLNTWLSEARIHATVILDKKNQGKSDSK